MTLRKVCENYQLWKQNQFLNLPLQDIQLINYDWKHHILFPVQKLHRLSHVESLTLISILNYQ